MRSDEMDRVVPMDQLDGWKVADEDPDIRGWDVITADGRKIGEVEQLLIDTRARKVRYVDVDLEDRENHVVIPIGYAVLDQDDHRVRIQGLAAEQIYGLPAYDHGPLTRDFEHQVGLACQRDFAAAPTDTAGDFYEHDHFRDGEARLTLSEEQLAIGTREAQAGEVSIRKDVVTEHVRESVPLRHDEVTVERRPISDPLRAGDARISEEEIRVPVMEEEAVVQKRVVPQEELVVRKREVVEEETVEADLRRERADVDRNVEQGGSGLDSDRNRRP